MSKTPYNQHQLYRYPIDIEDKLGFNQVQQHVANYCISESGRDRAVNMHAVAQFEQVELWLQQTKEFLECILKAEDLPTIPSADIRESLPKTRTEGNFLSEAELLDIANLVSAVNDYSNFFQSRKYENPGLHKLTDGLSDTHFLANQIYEKIDEEGRVKDDASPELREVRIAQRSRFNQVRKAIDNLFKNAVKSGFVPDGSSLTVRGGRMVIPVKAEYKRRVNGFIHDESSSGQIVFIEPTEVLEGNNELRSLENREKREVIRILITLTDGIRVHLDEIKYGVKFLSIIDFIRAKALFARELDAVLPQLHNKPHFSWEQAVHPLLKLAFKASGREVVPLNLELTENDHLLIISGPNAGGKSVCLKTVGLLQYMLQSGLLVPVTPDSSFGFFEKMFLDMGDEQSIENDLSTYSSHLTNMKNFLKHANGQSLILIDEFGTGTDPQFGGAIAQSILQRLNASGCWGVITTHYSNIKSYAENTPGLVNGAMRFDMEALEPLYQLEIGKPGSSFSLEIARKIGLSSDVVNDAKELIGGDTVDVDELLNQLEKKKQDVDSRDRELRSKENELKNLQGRYEKLHHELETNKKDIMRRAKQEAEQLLSKTNREIEKTIRHIKENKAQKTETKKARERLESLKTEVKTKEKKQPQSSIQIEKDVELKVGDKVLIIDQDVAGEIVGKKGKDFEVQIGDLKTVVKPKRLAKISKREEKRKNRTKTTRGFDMAQKRANFTSTLDVRGKRGEEVLPVVDKFLDDAILFGMNEVKILHGKGNGILKDMIRQHLKGASFIKSARDEDVEFGGAGITVLELK